MLWKNLITAWQPGQLVDINLPDRGITGTYLVQRVTVSPTGANQPVWTYQIQYGGRLLGIADFLKALVSAQQKKRLLEPAQSVQKFVHSEDILSIADTLNTASPKLPYVCGEPDAICGLVVVSNG